MLDQVMEFDNKQRSLIDCINKFCMVEGVVDYRKWFEELKKFVEGYCFDNGATSYMIDYNKLKGEVTYHIDKIENICSSISYVTRVFLYYKRKSIESRPFHKSLVSNGIITKEELDWMTIIYDGILHRFRANARLMDKILMEASKGKYRKEYMDCYDWSPATLRELNIGEPIEPFDTPIQDIIDEYAPKLVKRPTQKEEDVLKLAESVLSDNDVELIEGETKEQKIKRQNIALNQLLTFFEDKNHTENFRRKCENQKELQGKAKAYYSEGGDWLYRNGERRRKLMSILIELGLLPPNAKEDTFRRHFNK